MIPISLRIGALVALLALPALAQTEPEGTPTRIRGTVDSFAGHTLMVTSRDGQHLSITLADNLTVAGVAKRTLADIKTGDYIASTSMKDANGNLRAVEVHIFPEAMRGTAEGQLAWDLLPDSIMTNATVAGITEALQGMVIKVTYKGAESDITVPPDVPIVTYVPGDPSLLKPGAAIFTVALMKPDGSLAASRVTAEKDGVKPPM
jgi:hypothetical protein